MGIDETALNPVFRDDEFARIGAGIRCGGDRFKRCPGEALDEDFAPADIEAAIGRLQVANGYALILQPRHPGGV
ncbi:hypothetical protein D3C80_1773200 [compost metagenome]